MLSKIVTRLLALSLACLLLASASSAYAFDDMQADTAPTFNAAQSEAAFETSADSNESDTEEADAVYVPEVTLTLKTDGLEHAAYIKGYPNGTFDPEGSVTRAEAAVMLYSLLDETPAARVEFDDVPSDVWYYDEIGLLAAGGIIDFTDRMAYPEELLSRAVFVSMLSHFFSDSDEQCSYADVTEDTPYYADISKATCLGWINGYEDGTFRPDNPLSREEAVAVINRALGRTADKEKIDAIFPVFTDVSLTRWSYYMIMEATIPHTFGSSENNTEVWDSVDTAALPRPVGPMIVDQELYYIDETKTPVTGQYVGGLYFGEDGRYTSGDAEVDGYVKTVLSQITNDGMTREERLRAAYNYTRDSFSYLRRNYYDVGATGWEVDEARTMFSTGKGNCYSYAAAFCCLSRQLGYDAGAISGLVGNDRSAHGWVEISFNSTIYIFDPELEMAYGKRGKNIDLYMITYALAPMNYFKS